MKFTHRLLGIVADNRPLAILVGVLLLAVVLSVVGVPLGIGAASGSLMGAPLMLGSMGVGPEPGMSPFYLQHSTAGVTPADSLADGVRSDIWVYQVPARERIIIMPGAIFAAYLEDDSPGEVGLDAIIEVEIRDASEQDRTTIFGPVSYGVVKEFQDMDKVARLGIPEPIEVPARGKIVVIVNDGDTIDASDSRFLLETHRRAGGPARRA